MSEADMLGKDGKAKKAYQRRMTDKRRAQNREAQKVWREKQKKQIQELRAQAEATEEPSDVTSAALAPPQLPAHDPPFSEYGASTGNHDSHEDVDLMCAASIEHWATVAGDARTRCAPWQREQAQGSVIEIPADLDVDDFDLLESWTELDVLAGVNANDDFQIPPSKEPMQEQPKGPRWMSMPWLGGMPMTMNEQDVTATPSKDPLTFPGYDDFLLALTAPAELEQAVTPTNNAAAMSQKNPIRTPTTSTTATTPQSWTMIPTSLPSRTLRLTSISIHLACVTNARIFSITPTIAFTTRFSSPFYRPPTGPMTLAETSGSAASSHVSSSTSTSPADVRAAWYYSNKATNWKSIKKWLRPTPAQLTRPHALWIDTLPFPTLRERFLRLYQEIDGADLANDIAFNEGLVCWASCGDAVTATREGATAAGAVRTGMPWDVRNWEVKPWFVRKWWSTGLLGDEEDEVWEQCVWWLQFWEGLGEEGEGTLDEFLGSMKAL